MIKCDISYDNSYFVYLVCQSTWNEFRYSPTGEVLLPFHTVKMSYERKFDSENLVPPSFYLVLALMVPNSIPKGRRLDTRLGELVIRLSRVAQLHFSWTR